MKSFSRTSSSKSSVKSANEDLAPLTPAKGAKDDGNGTASGGGSESNGGGNGDSSGPGGVSASSSVVSLVDSEAAPPPDGKEESDDSKIKQLLGLLKKTIGVKDLGAMRLSLPANLMYPMPNLEYWHYLDRPDLFAIIGDSDDPLERMLATLRWALTKEAKFIHGPVCKPYNSVLGERFRCIWDVTPARPSGKEVAPGSVAQSSPSDPALAPSDSSASGAGASSSDSKQNQPNSPTSPSGSDHSDIFHDANADVDDNASSRSIEGIVDKLSLSPTGPDRKALPKKSGGKKASGGGATGPRVSRVAFVNEQVSHHPPVSCFWYQSESISGDDRKGKGRVIAYGVDQISAKFTGTSVKVYPGNFNRGIFVRLEDRDEEYEVSLPTANLTGLIRANPYVVIADHTYITCRGPDGPRYRAIMQYIDESWVGKAKFAMQGLIHEVEGDGKKEMEWTKLKSVPEDKVVMRFEGSWRGEIKVTKLRNDKSPSHFLVKPGELPPLDKRVREISKQAPEESRRFWKDVTKAIQDKKYSEATRVKQIIEQQQRDLAAERQRKKEDFTPVWFLTDWDQEGKPRLTDEGKAVLQKELAAEDY